MVCSFASSAFETLLEQAQILVGAMCMRGLAACGAPERPEAIYEAHWSYLYGGDNSIRFADGCRGCLPRHN
jgi:hypothetical protein